MKKALCAVLTLALILALAGCGGTTGASTSPTGSQSGAASSPAASTAPAAPTPTPDTPSPSPTSALLKVGDTAALGDWSVTVVSFDVTTSIKNGDYFSFNADDGDQYVIVTLTVKNNGAAAASFYPSYSFSNDDVSGELLYQNTYEFSSTNLFGYDQDLHDASLNPLSSRTGVIAFSVADEAATSNELTFQLTCGKDVAQWALS